MERTWTIGELAEDAAAALAADGSAQASGRVRDLPNERLIRWYTTIGLVDPPLGRRGRTSLYGPRHLLQLVAVKRRQAAGRSIAEIQLELAGATNTTLAQIAALPTPLAPTPPWTPRAPYALRDPRDPRVPSAAGLNRRVSRVRTMRRPRTPKPLPRPLAGRGAPSPRPLTPWAAKRGSPAPLVKARVSGRASGGCVRTCPTGKPLSLATTALPITPWSRGSGSCPASPCSWTFRP
ncbi:helix-turn-helix domain-containing protein [Actinomadura madurae]|uniref:MerR family transcriptional regulator n=1 Tax=Actinomadura madurae TaxID=1993 RepID=UPI0020D1FE1F|nr:MerR family transcriptional regulator [Actinomadura madurae]MCP9952744.1 helix-turn-helix domain-containing protein [Actinomadura madurae]